MYESTIVRHVESDLVAPTNCIVNVAVATQNGWGENLNGYNNNMNY